jgi:hypothetical protein
LTTASSLAGNRGNSTLIRFLKMGFSFPTMLAGILVFLAVLTARSRFDGSDLWWQLKMGQVICATHHIPLADIFSSTAAHQPLVPQEWLAEVAIFGAYKVAGYSGLMLWLCLFIALLLVAGYGLCTLYSGNAKVAFVGAMALWFFASPAYSIRPQLIAYLLLIAELALIQLGRTRNPRWFFWLPPLFALWINLHGSFILGIVVAAVFLFTSFVSFEIGSLISRRWNSESRKMFVLAIMLSVAALFINPIGLRQILYPFDTLLNMHVLLGNVQEWSPLKMSDSAGIALMAVLLSVFLLVALRISQLSFDELLLLTLGTWLAVSHLRMLIVFGILAAPILTRQLAASWKGYNAEEDRIAPNAIMIGLSLLVAWFAFPSAQELQAQVEAQSPVKAVDFLRAHPLPGVMLNEYDFGGYLIWAMPEHPVFIDGRTDIYEWSGLLGEFGSWAMVATDPNVLLQKYNVGFCLLARQAPMAHVLPLMPGWKLVYNDGIAVIIARTAPNH